MRSPVVGTPLTNPDPHDILIPESDTEEPTLTTEQLLEVEEQLSIPLGPYPTSTLSIGGFTMDSTLIANTQVVTVRALWEAGKLDPVTSNATEGSGLAAHLVTDYFADFNDRNRRIAITEETYRVMIQGGEPHNEVPDDDGLERIQTNIEPISADRQSSQEQAVDGQGRTKPYRDDTRFPARTPNTLSE